VKAAPGGLPWLLRQQLTWQWRRLSGGQRRGVWVGLAFAGLLLLGLFLLLSDLLRGADLNAPLSDAALGPVTLVGAFLLTLMVSAAVTAALEALFSRGDLDLLLHSPVSPRTVLAARALGVALASALAAALLLAPLTLVLLVLGTWRVVGVLGWWAAAALLSASLGLWLTLGLVRLLGVRRARTVASVVGALLGAGLFLASQLRNFTGGNFTGRRDGDSIAGLLAGFGPGQGGWPGRESVLWWPAQAAWAEGGPLLALLGGSVLTFGLTVALLTRLFVRGVQESGQGEKVRRGRRGAERPLRFGRASRATLLKEWRMIGRDPELLSRTLLQLVYLLPLLASAWRGQVGGTASAGVVLLTASLSRALAHLTLNAEDAPDLLVTAPRSPAALRRDKWLAATLPPTLLGLLGLAVFAAQALLGAGGAAALLGLLLLGTGGSALMVLWRPLPVRRADAFKTRERGTLVESVLALVFVAGLSGSAYALVRGEPWGLAALAAALITLGAAYSGRRTDAR